MITRTVYLDGAKLKRLRVVKGLTQRALATAAGVSPSTVNLLEQRKKNERFHPPTLVKLAEALDVEPAELLGDDDA
jgi:transcriptional regulator with XRE-family HTH domain